MEGLVGMLACMRVINLIALWPVPVPVPVPLPLQSLVVLALAQCSLLLQRISRNEPPQYLACGNNVGERGVSFFRCRR